MALGVMVLITVLSVMNGFESALKSRILGVAPHAIVQGTKPIQNWQSQRDALQNDPDITKIILRVNILRKIITVFQLFRALNQKMSARFLFWKNLWWRVL